jgi:hypothetical protein
MVAAPPMGAAMNHRGARLLRVLLTLALLIVPERLLAAERYAVVITGASGGPVYAQKYDAWRQAFVKTLRTAFAYPDDHLFVLAEQASAGVQAATRDNVRAVLSGLRTRATADDVVFVLLMGHGSGDAGEDDAKFNLVGPDLSSSEWAAALEPIRGRVVFIDTSSGSFPFLRRLAGPRRIVLTANDSAQQQFETVFPDFFVTAFEDDDADLDKNGRVSIWEAFVYASDGVRRWYEQRGQLATERPLLDDTGQGIGREAGTDGRDGMLAQVTYFEPEAVVASTGDAELDELTRRRAQLNADLEALRARRPSLSPDEYDQALERLLLEIAQTDRRIREKAR